MTKSTKRTVSAVLIFFMVLAVFVGIRPLWASAASNTTTGSGYTSASDVKYVTSGKYTANWGYRGEVCVFLSPYANGFYSEEYSFETLSKLEGGSSQNNASSSELYKSLQTLMKSKHTYETSYNATKNLYKYTDCQLSDYSKISSFYSGTTLSGTWGQGWNREHTWPNSKGLNGNDENDIMMLRPTAESENTSRGNMAYGQSSGYYNPDCETPPSSLKGDVARIFLYVYVRWGNTQGNSQYGTVWGKQGVMENLSVLLQWMEEDPVDTWEMGRNDAVQSITGTRNVFVDYPEYAWLLFGQDVPEGITTPSQKGSDGVTANPGGDSTGDGNTSGDSLVMVTTPESGVAYKLRMDKSTPLYFNGTISSEKTPWYLGTTEDSSQSKDVYVEQVSGGYKLYFYNASNVKTYFCVYKETKDNKTFISLCINEGSNSSYYDASGTTFKWNSTYNTFVATVDGTEYYMGTSDTYSTFSTNTISTASSRYPSHLYVEKEQGEHEHNYIISVVLPTCTAQGYTKHTCSCGDTYNDTYVEATGHKYTEKVIAPTCTEQGYTLHMCTCGDSYKDDYVGVTSHQYYTEVIEPTCTERGYTIYICHDCGDTYNADYVQATGHIYEVSVIEPSCTEQGYTYHICQCGDNYKDNYTDKTGHNYTSKVTEPTCTERGYTTYTCTCGDSYMDDYVQPTGHKDEDRDGVCDNCKQEFTPESCNHSYKETVTEPTCTERGYTTYECLNCGDKYIGNYVEKTPHNYTENVTEPTCTRVGFTTYACACGESYIGNYTEKIAHTYTPAVTAPTCTKRGYTTYTCVCGDSYTGDYTDATEHKYTSVVTEPTCTERGYTTHTCECGDGYKDTYVNAKGHDYDDTTFYPSCVKQGYTKHICKVCKYTLIDSYVDALGHKWVDANCTSGKHCAVCSVSEGEALGHKWIDATCTAPKTCTSCGSTEGVALGHVYESESDTVCKVCGETRELITEAPEEVTTEVETVINEGQTEPNVDDNGDGDGEKGGCGSVIGIGFIGLATAMAAGFVLSKKRD